LVNENQESIFSIKCNSLARDYYGYKHKSNYSGYFIERLKPYSNVFISVKLSQVNINKNIIKNDLINLLLIYSSDQFTTVIIDSQNSNKQY